MQRPMATYEALWNPMAPYSGAFQVPQTSLDAKGVVGNVTLSAQNIDLPKLRGAKCEH